MEDAAEIGAENSSEISPLKLFSCYMMRSLLLGMSGQHDLASKDAESALNVLNTRIHDDSFKKQYSSILTSMKGKLDSKISDIDFCLLATRIVPLGDIQRLASFRLKFCLMDLYEKGQYEEILKKCELARKVYPPGAFRLSLVEAYALEKLGRAEEALLLLSTFIENTPSDLEDNDLDEKIMDETFLAAAVVSASLGKPEEAANFLNKVESLTGEDLIAVANKMVGPDRSTPSIQNAVFLLEHGLNTSIKRNGNYSVLRAKVLLAGFQIDLNQLNKAEAILHEVMPAFNPHAWIPFSKPTPSEGYGEALITLSRLIRKKEQMGLPKVRSPLNKESIAIWIVLLMAGAILLLSLSRYWSVASEISRAETLLAGLHDNEETELAELESKRKSIENQRRNLDRAIQQKKLERARRSPLGALSL